MFEDASRLGAEHQEPVVEDERRDARDSDRLRLGGAGAHPVRQAAVLDRGGNLVLGKADVDCHLAKHLWVAEVAGFLPVGVHQPVVYRTVKSPIACQLG